MTCNNRTPLLHFPRASCTGSFDSICGWCLFLAHKAQRVYIIDLLYFRFNPLVPLNLNELSQKELTPLLPRHKRDGGLYNPHINFHSASVQHINWKAPNAAAILIFATAKVFANKGLLPTEEKGMYLEKESAEAWQSNPHSVGTILPSLMATQVVCYPVCTRSLCSTVLRSWFPNPFPHCLFISCTSYSRSTS